MASIIFRYKDFILLIEQDSSLTLTIKDGVYKAIAYNLMDAIAFDWDYDLYNEVVLTNKSQKRRFEFYPKFDGLNDAINDIVAFVYKFYADGDNWQAIEHANNGIYTDFHYFENESNNANLLPAYHDIDMI